MDFSALANSLQNTLGSYLPAIFGALGILIIGWIVAVLARAGTRRLLGLLKLNQRVADSTERRIDLESSVAIGVFWLVLIVTIVGVFNALNLELISNPFSALLTQVIGYLPKLVAGAALMLIAWLIATLLRAAVRKMLAATTLDEKLTEQAGMRGASRNLAAVLFWLVILLFVPAILSALDLRGLLEPMQAMLNKALALVPNVLAAGLIALVGWVVASILRGLTANFLSAAGAERLAERLGLAESLRLSRVIGTVVFVLVLVPTLIAALDALRVEAISGPATQMLAQMLQAVPNLIGATLILIVAFYVARFISNALARLLSSIGFDVLPTKLGLGEVFASGPAPSELVGGLVLLFTMLFATAEAASRLGFAQVTALVATFTRFAGDVVLGGVILLIGFWLANLAYEAIKRVSGAGTSISAQIARVAILGLVTAMGLRAMGIADDIVNLAFGLTLGAVAIAVALSFGLGGRDAAAKQMEHWLAKWREEPQGRKTGGTPLL